MKNGNYIVENKSEALFEAVEIVPDSLEEKKQKILKEIEESNLDEQTKVILKEIILKTNQERIVWDIECSLTEDRAIRDYRISQTMAQVAWENAKEKFKEAYELAPYNPYLYKQYNLDEIAIVNNLNTDIFAFPTQICIFTKLASYDSFDFYEMHHNHQFYIITDKSGKVLYTFDCAYDMHWNLSDKDKQFNLTSFEAFLRENDLNFKIEPSYSYLDLFESLTYDISKTLCDVSSDRKDIPAQNILVMSGVKPFKSYKNEGQDYYFLYYECPYLFINGRDIYTDVANKHAKITVSKTHEIIYWDYLNDMYIYNEAIDLNTGAISIDKDVLEAYSLFMKKNHLPISFTVSKDYLLLLDEQFNSDKVPLSNEEAFKNPSSLCLEPR